jgi:septation ring formation regulator
MGELAEFGSEVEEKLNEYQTYILSLKNDTEYCYAKVNEYSLELTTLYNTLCGLHHKVLSVIYEDEYNDVCSLIQNVNKSITTKPVDVKNVNFNCQTLMNKAENLLIDMKNSLKMYNMAQNIIVFTNKYRSSFTTVNEVLNRAQIHFENGEFEFAIDSVSEVLQEVHPKAYEEMMKRKGHKDE